MTAHLRRSLTILSLVAVMFFNVSGGAFTTESLIVTVGPAIGLLILVLVPIFWSVPEALIVGELASMLPEEGGYYRWVYHSWFVPGLSGVAQWFISLAVIWVATAINLRGAGRVGAVSVFSGVFILLTFFLVSVAAIPHLNHLPWASLGRTPASGASAIGVGVSIALWNYIGWDNASTVQGEVRDSSRNYPRALAITLP